MPREDAVLSFTGNYDYIWVKPTDMKQPKIYQENIEIPVIKERFSLFFAKSPYLVFKDTELLKEYANSFFDGNLLAAEEDLKGANALCINWRSKSMMILVLPFDVKPGVIAHECFHLTLAICEKKGITLCDESEEAFALVLDYLVQKTTEAKVKLDQHQKKKKSKK